MLINSSFLRRVSKKNVEEKLCYHTKFRLHLREDILHTKKPGNLSCLALKFERLIYDYAPAIQHAHIPHSTNCLLPA